MANGKLTDQQPPFTRGNASDAACDGHPWFIGANVDASGLCHREDVEVKWGEHAAGEARTTPGRSDTKSTLTLLIRGVFVLELAQVNQSFRLERSGDYVVYGPGIGHTWRVVEDCLVLTVRWSSR